MLTDKFKEIVEKKSNEELTLEEGEHNGEPVVWLLYKGQRVVMFQLNVAATDIEEWSHSLPLSINSGNISNLLKIFIKKCLRESMPNLEELKDAPYL